MLGFSVFFFNDTATTEIYTLSLHDALPISVHPGQHLDLRRQRPDVGQPTAVDADLVAQDALPDDLLGDGAEGGGDLLLPALELVGKRGLDLVLERVGGLLALLLAGDEIGRAHV